MGKLFSALVMEVNECDLRLGKMSRVGVDYRGWTTHGRFW